MSKMIGQNPCEDKVSINHGLYIKKIRINNSKTVSILKMLTKCQLPSFFVKIYFKRSKSILGEI